MPLVLIIVGSSLLVGYIVVGFVAANSIVERTTHPNYSTREQRQERNRKHGFLEGTECYKREETTFEMRDGYIIHGDVSLNDKSKFIIFAHGHGSTREGAYKYTKIFYDLGYSLVMYDERGHGDNERVPCTMGFNESKDLVEIVKASFSHSVGELASNVILAAESSSSGSVIVTVCVEAAHVDPVVLTEIV